MVLTRKIQAEIVWSISFWCPLTGLSRVFHDFQSWKIGLKLVLVASWRRGTISEVTDRLISYLLLYVRRSEAIILLPYRDRALCEVISVLSAVKLCSKGLDRTEGTSQIDSPAQFLHRQSNGSFLLYHTIH